MRNGITSLFAAEGLDIRIVADDYGTHQVERWFAYLTDQMIRRGTHRSVQALETDILDSLTRYLQRMSGGDH